ncbi:MAG: hypothetical protein PWP28_1999 [Oceanotoga sp.]|uniref:hypothetical protein n=1 Tax=Oceanotoga sp. TaxID=2108366 RepID=UPI00264E7521|nr:hypothetical protein [Oceanotoga sp.]MDN5343124.1 hypothetical protein [Oceanotoga sp.]
MQDNIKLKIFDEDLTAYGKPLLSILLKDRTTGKNIIWATNDYIQLGEIYKAENEISLNIVNRGSEKFIRPRITKSYEKQNNRTRDKAEVFTPSWVCNEQNNLIDEQWFGRKNVFNIAKDRDWIPNNEKIEFPNVKNKTWKDYVDARRMEITCGEAPYLVSRYDTVTGEVINLKSRIGLLDRKIRVVSENARNEEEWLRWTVRAFQSVYGYEFQGDNLLLARENLLHTFIDNVRDKLKREPSLKELKRIATIISWNIWQMDGLTFAIPFSELREEYQQMSLFENLEDLKEKPEDKYCKIKNWRSNIILEYRTLLEGRKNG